MQFNILYLYPRVHRSESIRLSKVSLFATDSLIFIYKKQQDVQLKYQ